MEFVLHSEYKTKLFYLYELHVKCFHYNADPLGMMLLGWEMVLISEHYPGSEASSNRTDAFVMTHFLQPMF